MRYYYRAPIWPIVLIPVVTVLGIAVFVGRYPLITMGIVIVALGSYVMGASLHDSWKPSEWDSTRTQRNAPPSPATNRTGSLDLEPLLGRQPVSQEPATPAPAPPLVSSRVSEVLDMYRNGTLGKVDPSSR